ncbi:hypothetical protein ANCCEY_11550 [Ancylostoma ceylanicum]|uniref:NR LBD domain-containing protein n=1 Tax=Ancylostoma ceylanicum TaxID=53326 RepID=A0A0D6LBW6_9BILA|nr:hypothetical protein ANCCEY_11550 [Ancylostoma ceylanicum]
MIPVEIVCSLRGIFTSPLVGRHAISTACEYRFDSLFRPEEPAFRPGWTRIPNHLPPTRVRVQTFAWSVETRRLGNIMEPSHRSKTNATELEAQNTGSVFRLGFAASQNLSYRKIRHVAAPSASRRLLQMLVDIEQRIANSQTMNRLLREGVECKSSKQRTMNSIIGWASMLHPLPEIHSDDRSRILEELLVPLRRLRADEAEFSCLKALILLNGDVATLSEQSKGKLREARDALLKALFGFFNETFSALDASLR